jgi:hypothetical protein
MRGPKTKGEALAWAQEAMQRARYRLAESHFGERSEARNFTIFDAKRVIATATKCEPYASGQPRNGGSCWRIFGEDLDGVMTGVGIELFRDHLGKVIVLVTLVDAS